MMTRTFLREVHLKDFRTFGTFTLPVAPGPGLTLLVGTNGLGKSSFFDGLEWCLTGCVRRFQNYIGRLKESEYLTRRDAKPGTHLVRLTFSEDHALQRAADVAPSEADLLSLLKVPDWTEIKDLGAYLGFTHFLGQASQQRFTSRDQSDQWQALKGPSGIDRLESVRTALRGRATTNAFRRRTEHEQQAVETATRLLEEWRKSAQRLAELTERSAASGAESASSLSDQLSVLARALAFNEDASLDMDRRLTSIRANVEAELQSVALNRATVESLPSIEARFAEAFSLTDKDGGRRGAADRAVATATNQLSDAMLAASQAEHAAAAQAEVVARAEAEHEERVRVVGSIKHHALLDAELSGARGEKAALYAQREAIRTDLETARATLTSAREAQAKLLKFDSDQSTLQLWSDRITALLAQEASARLQSDAATTAAEAAGRARNDLPRLEREAEEAKREQLAAETRLAARRRDASELAELLTALAGHIDHDDTDCPVCLTTFAPGELHDRARRALAAQDLQLSNEVRALEAIKERSGLAAQAMAQAQAAISAEVAATSEAEALREAAAAERAAIAAALRVPPESRLESIIARSLAAIADARSTHIRDVGGTPDAVKAAEVNVEGLTATLGSIEARIADVLKRQTRSESELKLIEDKLANVPKPWNLDAAQAAVDEQSGSLAAARASHHDLGLKRAAAANTEAAAREKLLALEAERERLLTAIHDAEKASAAAISAWQSAGMDGEPTTAAIERRAIEIDQRAALLAKILADLDALSRRYQAWLTQDELRKLRSEMNAIGGAGSADNPVAREQDLQNALAAARAALQLTLDTRDAVVSYGEQLKSEAESFSTKFLLPLNDLIDAFNRALLSTPGETVQFNAEHTVERTALAMALRYADPIENAQYRTALPPQLVLSEGQMAANGFSILCAASTAYQWSRWRALLLDDPLQHNDIIHAAAFVDVMRNLVELEGYQLVMSSHKRDEGEFIARKFDAAGLPCTVVELIGASKDGVRAEPPRHNAAARALLAEPQARFA